MRMMVTAGVWPVMLLMAAGSLAAEDDPFAPADPFAPVAESKAAVEAARKRPTRFTLESHTLKSAGDAKPQTLTFRLNTASGDVWRFDGKALVRLVPEGVTIDPPAAETDSEEDLQEQAERDALERRMEKIIIPAVNFKEARLEDVMRFLQDASREYDPEKKGVSFVRIPEVASTESKSGATERIRPSVPDPFEAVPADHERRRDVPGISFQARYTPLSDILAVITSYADLKVRVKGCALLWSEEWLPSDLKTHTFWLSTEVASFLQPYHPSSNPTADLRAFLSDFGMNWPAGASVALESGFRALVVVNTRANLEACRRLLAGVDAMSAPGRFALLAVDHPDGARDLVLTDSETGETWKYQPAVKDAADANGAEERFVSVRERAAGGK